MKKSIYSAMFLGSALVMASCANDTIIDSPAATGDVTVTVQTSDVLARAGVAEVEGYELKCIMQLVDETGAIVGTQTTQDAASGSTTFVITGDAQDKGAVQALFWAEYQPTASGAEKVYNTDDLTAVTYNTTAFNLADENLIAACDAFSGCLQSFSGELKVTLTRPFAKVSLTPENPENAKGCNKLEVSYNAPAGYSVISGTTSEKLAVTYTNDSFDPESTPWFTNYIFGNQSSSFYDEEMNIKVSGAKDFDLTIPAGKIPTDANYLVNATFELGDAPTQDINVDINIDDIWNNDPNKPVEMMVGSYVNANGEAVADKANAVGIVFAMGALEGDVIANYPAEYAGKTIKAYAVALDKIGNRLSFGDQFITGLTANNTTATNGVDATKALIEFPAMATTEFASTYSTWLASNALTGNNTTNWYIGSLNQMQYWFSLLYKNNNGEGATGSDAFKALFPESQIFDREVINTVNYASSTVNTTGNLSGIRLNCTDGVFQNWQAAGIDVVGKINQSAIIRPMFTIFE